MPNPTTIIAAVVRPAVQIGVSGARVPVDLVSRALGEQGNGLWPPVIAFETAQAAVLRTTGSLLHDGQLQAQGRLIADKLERLRAAEQLETEAEAKLQHAEEERRARNEAAARKRQHAAEQAKERKAAAKRRADQQKRQAEEQAEADAAAAEQRRTDAEQRIEAQQRKERTAAIATERRAIAKEKAAAAAVRKAAATDARIKAVNQARKV